MAKVLHRDRVPQLVQPWCDEWERTGEFDIVCTRGTTTDALQLSEYAKGRKQLPDGSWIVIDSRAVVTNAQKASASAHGHACAGDFHPVRELFDSGGVKLIYLGDEGDPVARAEALRRFGVMDDHAEAFGMETGRNFPGLCDRPHVSVKGWEQQPLAPGVSA